MPSDDFWSDLPSERNKKPIPVQPAPTTEPPVESPTVRLVSPPARQPALTPPPVVPPEQPLPPRRDWTVGRLVIKFFLALIVGTAVGLGTLLVQGLATAAAKSDTTPQLITINHGLGTYAISQLLESDGLVISRWPIFIYLKLTRRLIQAGVYSLSPNFTPLELVARLASGKTSEQIVTIPEGWRLEQIADLLAKAEIVTRADFLRAANYDPVRYTLPTGFTRQPGDTLEGLLFPDTYRFAYGTTSKEIVTRMLENFAKRTDGMNLTNEDLILASIIEREAKLDDDRAPIAGVYHNRLQQNIKLQADPTVQYGKETLAFQVAPADAKLTWWQPITTTDYQTVKSPYNTYLISGLPPGPIASPGLKSLTAAKNPTLHDYYFFYHAPDGTTIFSKTAEEHQRAQQTHQTS